MAVASMPERSRLLGGQLEGSVRKRSPVSISTSPPLPADRPACTHVTLAAVTYGARLPHSAPAGKEHPSEQKGEGQNGGRACQGQKALYNLPSVWAATDDGKQSWRWSYWRNLIRHHVSTSTSARQHDRPTRLAICNAGSRDWVPTHRA